MDTWIGSFSQRQITLSCLVYFSTYRFGRFRVTRRSSPRPRFTSWMFGSLGLPTALPRRIHVDTLTEWTTSLASQSFAAVARRALASNGVVGQRPFAHFAPGPSSIEAECERCPLQATLNTYGHSCTGSCGAVAKRTFDQYESGSLSDNFHSRGISSTRTYWPSFWPHLSL